MIFEGEEYPLMAPVRLSDGVIIPAGTMVTVHHIQEDDFNTVLCLEVFGGLHDGQVIITSKEVLS